MENFYYLLQLEQNKRWLWFSNYSKSLALLRNKLQAEVGDSLHLTLKQALLRNCFLLEKVQVDIIICLLFLYTVFIQSAATLSLKTQSPSPTPRAAWRGLVTLHLPCSWVGGKVIYCHPIQDEPYFCPHASSAMPAGVLGWKMEPRPCPFPSHTAWSSPWEPSKPHREWS